MSEPTLDDVINKATAILKDDPGLVHDLASVYGLGFVIHITDVHNSSARWGEHRTVIYACKINRRTRYFGVDYYHVAGDGNSDDEREVREYEAFDVNTVEWRPKK